MYCRGCKFHHFIPIPKSLFALEAGRDKTGIFIALAGRYGPGGGGGIIPDCGPLHIPFGSGRGIALVPVDW